MIDTPDAARRGMLRSACRHLVRALIQKHDWALLNEVDLVEAVLASAEPAAASIDLEKKIFQEYTLTLYQACRQASDPARRERGYYELSRFLYRAAHNRWPELAQDATQRALLLVYQQIERCHEPAAFLAFALNKLRQAFTEEQRAGRKNSFQPPQDNQPNLDKEEQIDLEIDLHRRDGQQRLLAALAYLPNKRQQQAIFLKFFGSLSDEEIAARLEVTAAYVRKLRYDGLTRLRQDEGLRNFFEVEEKSSFL